MAIDTQACTRKTDVGEVRFGQTPHQSTTSLQLYTPKCYYMLLQRSMLHRTDSRCFVAIHSSQSSAHPPPLSPELSTHLGVGVQPVTSNRPARTGGREMNKKWTNVTRALRGTRHVYEFRMYQERAIKGVLSPHQAPVQLPRIANIHTCTYR